MGEIEGVRLAEEVQLVTALCVEDGARDGTEAAVVDSGDGWVVVGELGRDLGRRDEGELGLLEHAVVVVAVDGVIGVVVVGGGHDRRTCRRWW